MTNDISGLENALKDRARMLAQEHLVNAHQARDLMLIQTRHQLRLEEEREILIAKAQAERVYLQRVQAVELELRARLDSLRWALVEAALDKLEAMLLELTLNKTRYLSLLLEYLRLCAQSIERDDLIARFNAADLPLMQSNWQQYALQAAPGKRLVLSPEPLESIGGVLVISADGNIRFDNTFEGRRARRAIELQDVIAERLLSQTGDSTNG
jgi:V/A-type H+-transporting ATPase subunit E